MGIALWEHNRTAYEAVRLLLNQTGKAAVVHPTGTGKSFIGFKLCEDQPDKRICWLSPSEYIFQTQLENLKRATGEKPPKNLCFYTYPRLMGMEEEEIAQIQPDYIVFDEFHRCGAPLWGAGVQRLLQAYPETPILGLSATNIRYLDNRRDMAQELFDGCVASQMTLGEAIVRGILTPPTYVTALYSYRKDLWRYEQRMKRIKQPSLKEAGEKYLEALRRALEKADGLADIFHKHMTDRSGKYLVFCANAQHMGEMIGKASEHFAQVDTAPHIYSAYASDPATSQAFADFKADRSPHLKLLYCIDMLNEGIHVDDISGVILFRPTVSPIVFKQQIGRALCAGKRAGAVILDIVDNITSLYSIGVLQEEMTEVAERFRQEGKHSAIINDTFHIIDEVQDCRRLFEQLEGTLSVGWERMYEEAKCYYRRQGDLLAPYDYITEEGYRLGRWIAAQRSCYAKGELSVRRIEQLNAIGMCWQRQQERWETALCRVKKYRAKHGDANLPAGYIAADGFRLGDWLSVQRRLYREGRLPKERAEQLEELGICWNKAASFWEEGCQRAEDYFRRCGNLNVGADYVAEDGFRLGNWIANQKARYKSGQLTQAQIRRLEAASMVWEPQKQRWQQGFSALRQYAQEHGSCHVPQNYRTPEGYPLGTWVDSQRKAYRKRTLSEEQICALNALGMAWERREERWQNGYAHVAEYCRRFGMEEAAINSLSGTQQSVQPIVIARNYVSPDGFALGEWLRGQQRQYQKGCLHPKHQALLTELGVFSEELSGSKNESLDSSRSKASDNSRKEAWGGK